LILPRIKKTHHPTWLVHSVRVVYCWVCWQAASVVKAQGPSTHPAKSLVMAYLYGVSTLMVYQPVHYLESGGVSQRAYLSVSAFDFVFS
jgi:hypothetical protein